MIYSHSHIPIHKVQNDAFIFVKGGVFINSTEFQKKKKDQNTLHSTMHKLRLLVATMTRLNVFLKKYRATHALVYCSAHCLGTSGN